MSSAPRRSSATGAADGPGLNDYLHKTVAFRFEGHTLRLALSQSLFSSYDVDAGSRLLLASVVRELAAHPEERGRLQSILDLGCGAGVLGVALAKQFAAALVARDRDALALAVTARNAAANGVACTTRGGVDTTDLDGSREPARHQLVVSNLPAKAGAPVLARLLAAAAEATAPGGRVAVVVVAPLADEVRRGLGAVAELIHEHHGNRHAVFHGRPHSPVRTPAATGLTAYRRHQGEVAVAGLSYPLATVYGLPDFDTPSHLLQLTATLLRRNALPPPAATELSALAWNPGQGHLPVWLARAWAGARPAPAGGGLRITLASRDALQLLATRANLTANGVAEAALTLRHEITLDTTATPPHELALLHPDADLNAAARRTLMARLVPLVTPAGNVVLFGPAPAIAPLLARRRPFTPVRESRRRALRAALLRAPAG